MSGECTTVPPRCMTNSQTLILRHLAAQGVKQSELARKLRVARQSLSPWLHGGEPTPRARQAQIAVTLGIKAADYFDSNGFARR